ncbi:MAG: hypothetical protein GF308_00630 [Candidatus Heimdallarchaeota archaeon]|nr:hypothetical protein [Candidatus Heimdallarchaeota archaeon]
MPTSSLRKKSLNHLSIFLVCLLIGQLMTVSISQFSFLKSSQEKIAPIKHSMTSSVALYSQSLKATGEDCQLVIKDFSHNNRPIYANFSRISFTFEFKANFSNYAQVSLSYSRDRVNWTKITCNKGEQSSENATLFNCELGPFEQVGIYYLRISAEMGGTTYATIYTRIIVEQVAGIVFTDFEYAPSPFNWSNPYLYVYVKIFGEKLNPFSVTVSYAEKNQTKMNLFDETTHTYRGTLGPFSGEREIVYLNFTANTTNDVLYYNANYFVTLGSPDYQEDFWRVRFPAIIVVVVVMGAISTIFIMSKMGGARRKYE